jgi:hypothetical protein
MKHMKSFNEGLNDNKPNISDVSVTYTYFFDQNHDGIERIENYGVSNTSEWKIFGADNAILWSYEGLLNEDTIDDLLMTDEIEKEYIPYIEVCLSHNPLSFTVS